MKIYSLVFVLLAGMNVQAQTFHSRVKIEFEKTVYTRQLYRDLDPDNFERFGDRIPNSTVSNYLFIGDTAHSLYRSAGTAETIQPFDFSIAEKNVVYNDYRNRRSIAQKPVFEEIFLVSDTLLSIRWRLTPDTRMIAGYECRKAIGIIDDTIAVFAFYTPEILVCGGPESIQGLPGMILGVGVPRLHTTWFATSVQTRNIYLKEIAPATKGKKVDRRGMVESLDRVFKSWGSYGRNLFLNYLI